MSQSGENKGLCHVIPGSKLRVEHTATQSQMIRGLCQEARSTEHVKHILTCPASASSRTCSYFAAGKGESGCRPPCDSSCRTLVIQLISCLHFLWSPETSHSIDAGHTVKRLVYVKELVDSTKPAMCHDDRPILEKVRSPSGEKRPKRRDKTLLYQ